MNRRSEGLLTAENHAYRRPDKKLAGQRRRTSFLSSQHASDDYRLTRCNLGRVMQIDILPDDLLLEIFDFRARRDQRAWQSLVHVCRRWRSLVFASPRRLNLRLCCTPKTPAKDTLNVWPAFPLIIQGIVSDISGINNTHAALEQSNRVSKIDLDVPMSGSEKVLAAMQVPFPRLTDLGLCSYGDTVPVLPNSDSFSDGFAPCLRNLRLGGIPYPGLPKLLLSATPLVSLQLWKIPHSGYVSPEAIATCLTALTSLETVWLGFESPLSHPDWNDRRPPPPTRSVLPSLTLLRFNGVSEYLEDLVARIDTPRLDFLDVTFFNQIVFDTPQFIQFISRTPSLKALEEARIAFAGGAVKVTFSSQTSGCGHLNVEILCRETDWQLSSLEQVCTPSFPPVSMVENLYVYEHQYEPPVWKDNIDNTLWLETLHAFTAVKNLYLSRKIAPLIARALNDFSRGRITEVLPTMRDLFLESKRVRKDMVQLADARKLVGRPFNVSSWDRDSERDCVAKKKSR
jgi:hypothetical protein